MIQKLTIDILKNFAPICAVGAFMYHYTNYTSKDRPFKDMFMQRTFEVLTYSFLEKVPIENKLIRFVCSAIVSIGLTNYFSNKKTEDVLKHSTISVVTESAFHIIVGKRFLGGFFAPKLVRVLIDLKLIK